MRRGGSARILRRLALAASAFLIAGVPSAFAGAVLTLGSPVTVSGPTPFTPGCNGAPQTGTNFPNAEVEPWVDINPVNASNIVAVWQQDRWSNGGSNGLLAGVSFDGGATWTRTAAPFARCEGGTAANGGNFERASDPWVSFGPSGSVYQASLSFNNSNFTSAVLVSKSTDGGLHWGNPKTVILDTAPTVFNDKESITADPGNANLVYVVWDRLVVPTARARGVSFEHAIGFRGPAWFSRSTDGGDTWAAPRIIFDPGEINQTIGNQILVLPNGTLIDGFNLIFNVRGLRQRGFNVALIRSTDKGVTWSRPIIVSKLLSRPVTDPNTGQAVRTGDILPAFAVDRSSGTLYAVWMDTRFSGGVKDDIAFSMSTDGGLTWTAPVKINKTPGNAPAFTASVKAGPDGRIAVTYYDFRSLAAGNTTTLPTDYWMVNCLVNCTAPASWTEQHLAGPFDMMLAPNAGGFFVGDYEGLGAAASAVLTLTDVFQPVFAAAVSPADPTDVFTLAATTPEVR